MKFFKSKQTTLVMEWNNFSQKDLKIIQTIFYKSFVEKAYKNLSSFDLKLKADYFRAKYPISNDRDIVKYFVKEIAAAEIIDIAAGKLQCVLARLNGKIVGCATFKVKPETATLYIDLLAVLPNYASFGIGSSIIENMQRKFPHLNGIVLYTRKILTGSEIFYGKLGFEQKPLEDLQITIKAKQYPGFDLSISADDYVGFKLSGEKNRCRRNSLPDSIEFSTFKITPFTIL